MPETLHQAKCRIAVEAFNRHHGNISAAAKELDIHRETLIRFNGTRTPTENSQLQSRQPSLPMPETMSDFVDHPPHYKGVSGIECIEAIEAMGCGVPFCRANAVKHYSPFSNRFQHQPQPHRG